MKDAKDAVVQLKESSHILENKFKVSASEYAQQMESLEREQERTIMSMETERKKEEKEIQRLKFEL